MRLLYLTEERIEFSEAMVRGGAIHVLKVIGGLRERGHDVHLIDWNDSPSHPFQWSVTPTSRFIDGAFRTFLRAVSICRKQDIDVIVSKTRKTYVAGLAAARVVGVPHVVHVGALPTPNGDGPVERLDAASFSGRLQFPHDGYFVVCRAISELLRDRGVPEDSIYPIRNAVDVNRFDPDGEIEPSDTLRRALAGIDEEFVIGFIGGLYEYKGLSDLAAAVAQMEIEVRVIIAGEGPYQNALERALGDQGTFLGAVAYESMPAVYGALDALVLPSYTEGLPRVVLEAQAMKTPVVATRVGGIPEIIDDGDTGLLCDTNSPDQIAERLRRLASDSETREHIARNSRAAVTKDFSWQEMYERYERYLTRIVEK
jgi:starch synthase